ncbi:MAG: hypothetical protein CMK07_05465 [Ponticaulis sp.]|nr:hypothetical protein [Ponticaulis sp.]
MVFLHCVQAICAFALLVGRSASTALSAFYVSAAIREQTKDHAPEDETLDLVALHDVAIRAAELFGHPCESGSRVAYFLVKVDIMI